MFESSPDLSVNTVAEIVRLALAPVFLLSGIGAFLNVLASRLSRIVDRTRDIEPMLLASRGAEHDRWIAAMKILDRRMSLISWATGLAVTSAILTCLVVILLFAANIIRTRLGTEIAWLFIVLKESCSDSGGDRRGCRGERLRLLSTESGGRWRPKRLLRRRHVESQRRKHGCAATRRHCSYRRGRSRCTG